MNYIIPFVSLLLLLAGCNGTDKTSNDKQASDTILQADSPVIKQMPVQPQDHPDTGQYCYIKKVYTKGDSTFIEADFIQFLMGNAAVEAAKKRGEAMAEPNAKGDTTYSLPDGYYIINDNTLLRTLPLAKNVEMLFVQFGGSQPDTIKPAFGSLAERAKNDAIFILTIQNGIVKKVKQQYVP